MTDVDLVLFTPLALAAALSLSLCHTQTIVSHKHVDPPKTKTRRTKSCLVSGRWRYSLYAPARVVVLALRLLQTSHL